MTSTRQNSSFFAAPNNSIRHTSTKEIRFDAAQQLTASYVYVGDADAWEFSVVPTFGAPVGSMQLSSSIYPYVQGQTNSGSIPFIGIKTPADDARAVLPQVDGGATLKDECNTAVVIKIVWVPGPGSSGSIAFPVCLKGINR